ncbi:MAG: hypothetical protein WC150_11270 [Bacteroidia bacterium]
MAQNTKIIPTNAELEIASNTNFFDVKRELTAKIVVALEQFGEQLLQEVVTSVFLKTGIQRAGLKVSKGENFKGYPYIVLDCPRLYSTDTEVICRTIFRWGHGWSLHFTVQGKTFSRVNHSLPFFSASLSSDWLLYTGENIWEQDVDSVFFLPTLSISETSLSHTINRQGFFKIATQINLSDAVEWPPFPQQTYQILFDLLK